MGNHKTDLLIIGAGPFGLAIAAQAAHLGIEYLVVGKPMEFWRKNMPPGMYLRSSWDWHLDPLDVHTIESFLESRGQTTAEIEPLSLDFYLEYAEWFQNQKGIVALPWVIQRVDRSAENGSFIATASEGHTIEARNVALAPGFRYFANVPEELKSRLPAGSYEHTCEFVDFSAAADKRYLIVGGRQSAFEWAALLLEAGAQSVYISHRHDSPAFAVFRLVVGGAFSGSNERRSKLVSPIIAGRERHAKPAALGRRAFETRAVVGAADQQRPGESFATD